MNEHVLTPAQRQAFTRLRAMMQAYLVERDTEMCIRDRANAVQPWAVGNIVVNAHWEWIR